MGSTMALWRLTMQLMLTQTESLYSILRQCPKSQKTDLDLVVKTMNSWRFQSGKIERISWQQHSLLSTCDRISGMVALKPTFCYSLGVLLCVLGSKRFPKLQMKPNQRYQKTIPPWGLIIKCLTLLFKTWAARKSHNVHLCFENTNRGQRHRPQAIHGQCVKAPSKTSPMPHKSGMSERTGIRAV